jgi:hypothetical protein
MGISFLRRPSAALVVSIIALLVALGGSSYAAFRLPSNSVGTKQLKAGAVTTKKLAHGAKVSNAVHADEATSAGSASSATTAGHASHADDAVNADHATNADTATNAGHASTASNANAVDGSAVTKVFFHGAAGAAPVQVFSADGLVISAGCNNPGNQVVVLATGSTPGNTAHLQFQDAGGASRTLYDEEVAILSTSVHGLANYANGSGSFDYTTATGGVITMTYGYSSDDISDGGCTFSGIAIASS